MDRMNLRLFKNEYQDCSVNYNFNEMDNEYKLYHEDNSLKAIDFIKRNSKNDKEFVEKLNLLNISEYSEYFLYHFSEMYDSYLESLVTENASRGTILLENYISLVKNILERGI